MILHALLSDAWIRRHQAKRMPLARQRKVGRLPTNRARARQDASSVRLAWRRHQQSVRGMTPTAGANAVAESPRGYQRRRMRSRSREVTLGVCRGTRRRSSRRAETQVEPSRRIAYGAPSAESAAVTPSRFG